MAYIRKTRDYFELQANYGHGDGWECLTAELTYREARQRAKEYRENDPTPADYRIKRKRERIEAVTSPIHQCTAEYGEAIQNDPEVLKAAEGGSL